MSNEIMTSPCFACPYRRDVPSGIWSAEEYEKLPPYDAETVEQPFEPFACHASPDRYCHGWAVCHSNRGCENALISLRLVRAYVVPDVRVELFESGQEACDHGKRDIGAPSRSARQMVARLITKHKRLKAG